MCVVGRVVAVEAEKRSGINKFPRELRGYAYYGCGIDSGVVILSAPRVRFCRNLFWKSSVKSDMRCAFYPHIYSIYRIRHQVGWLADVRGVWPGGSCLRLRLVSGEDHHTALLSATTDALSV